MADQRYVHSDDASQNGRHPCRLRSDANRARRHELAVARVAEAMRADDIDGMLAALPDVDMDMLRRFYETHRPARRSTVVRRNARRLAAVTLITTATLATVHVDTAGAAVSCSLRVIARTDNTMVLRYDPPDSIARTVWVDGQPHTIAPHDTAVVPAVDTIMYPTAGDVIVVDDIDVTNPSSQCGGPATTTTSTSSTTTSTTVAPTTTTDALTTITVVRTTPEPTTTTAPLPPATWTIVDTPTTTSGKLTTLPETGASSGDIATVGLWVLVGGALVAAAMSDQIKRKDDER